MIEEIIPEEVILDEEEVLDESAGTEGLNPLQQAPAQPQFGYRFGSVGQGMQPSLITAPPVSMDRKYGAKHSDYRNGVPVEKELPIINKEIIEEEE